MGKDKFRNLGGGRLLKVGRTRAPAVYLEKRY